MTTSWRIFFVVALCVGYLSGCSEEKHGYVPLQAGSAVKLLAVSNDQGLNSKNNYVSVAPLADNKFVIANYVSLLVLDRDAGSLCKVSAESVFGDVEEARLSEDQQHFLESITYNPTGVFVGGNGKLYVANYKANNILVGSLDAAGCKYLIEGEYSSVDTRGPENVVVDQSANLLISANYDAGTIVAFDLDSKEEKWSAAIAQAHGVTVSGGKVFATGLTERKVYEIDIKTGKIINSKGSLGWNPMESQYIWPTSIFSLNKDELVVADPQSGFVSVLNSSTLDVIRYTGGNGPSENLFNYPYAAVPVDGELMVLSSMRGEILFLNSDDMDVSERLSFSEERWSKPEAGETKSIPVFGQEWKGYVDMSEFSVKLRGEAYRLGFGNLSPKKSGPVLNIPDSGSLFNTGAYIYFLQGYTESDVDIIFSSSSQTLLGVVHKDGYPDVLIPRLIDLDSWKVGESLVSGIGKSVNFERLSADIKDAGAKYYGRLDDIGWVEKTALYSVLAFSDLGLDYDQFLTRLDAAFATAAGREFKLAYDQCSESTCDRSALKKAAYSYFRETSNLPYISLDEYSLVGMISGISPMASQKVNVDYQGCEGATYYQGYGVEILKTDTLNDYLSAVDLPSSSLCVSVKGDASVIGLDVIWNDVETAPKSLEIYGRDGGEGSHWELLKKYSGIKVVVVGGYATSQFTFDNKSDFSKFYIKVLNGGVQNRLILRQVKPILSAAAKSAMVPSHLFAFVHCPMGGNYLGYGTEALETNSLNDYLSAQSLETSSVCFSSSSDSSLVGLNLGWYSADEVGTLVQVFGSASPTFSREVSVGKFNVGDPYSISNFFFSDIAVKPQSRYPFYRVRLLEGKGQGRLLLRSFTPIYSVEGTGGNAAARRLARAVSKNLHYGVGVSSASHNTKQSLDDLERLIASAENAHCGNYALVFVSKLPKNTVWKVYDVSANDGRVHSVVELEFDREKYVYDPTLGIEYRCSLSAMIDGACKYSADPSFYQVNPVLRAFRGAGFFYGANIKNVYSSSRDLISPYF
ncbi:hypothetical protein BLL42_28195 (plasmid) [Pseudomonas frederiksbergensis]|uniref:Uncharacterized protein n=1 Tax=Pseudomonas frederiksbergensis TaxID=104087 RepID=A0A1J0EUF4_9PSED|nr:hypothetical protein [Pseudomonas frederiksbergensis]APC19595.1 hypothetical protein BLL42_28195 [Pseudomonas frederiksbergensis]